MSSEGEDEKLAASRVASAEFAARIFTGVAALKVLLTVSESLANWPTIQAQVVDFNNCIQAFARLRDTGEASGFDGVRNEEVARIAELTAHLSVHPGEVDWPKVAVLVGPCVHALMKQQG